MNKSIYLLDNLAVYEISGNDCIEFLHNQFCNDLRSLNTGKSQLSAHCNIKGRVQAMFILHRLAEEKVLMLIDQQVADKWLAKLKMYVMRSDVTFTAATDKVYAALNNESIENATNITLPHINAIQYFVTDNQVNSQQPDATLTTETIKAGIPLFDENQMDRFLPQMWSLDLIDGMSFTKGCYPGQEIVIRTAHKGQLKKRLMMLSGDSSATGTELSTEDGALAAEIVGQVEVDGSVLVQAVVRIEYADGVLVNSSGNRFTVG